jgi:hypothetical protein
LCNKQFTKNNKNTSCSECTSKRFINLSTPIENLFCAGTNKYSRIRNHARPFSKKHPQCYVCKYNKHVEVAHIKPISEFDPSTPIGVVNHVTNLMSLCSNHHWEFDHNLLNKSKLIQQYLVDVLGIEPSRDP